MQTDPISDFLTSIRNAVAAKHQRVDVPASRLKSELARILKEEGYISTFKMVDENKSHKTLRVFPEVHPGPPQRHHRCEAHFAPRRAPLYRRHGHPSGGRRTGHQHSDHSARIDERTRCPQSSRWRRTAVRSLVVLVLLNKFLKG